MAIRGALLVACLIAFGGQERPVAQDPSFRATSSELVVLPVVVQDKQGRYVTDLARDRFAVYDNARRIPVDFFSSQDTPVTIGLIMDSSGSMRRKLGEVIAATITFANASNPDDEVFAIRFNDTAKPMHTDQRFLLAGNTTALETVLTSIVPDGRTALYDAVADGLDYLQLGTRPRRVLIVISDGGDNASHVSLASVLQRARASSAVIYTIGLFDVDDTDRNPGVLKQLAHETGGERFLPESPGALLQICERIAHEIRSGYTLGFVPPDRDGLFHRIRVALEPPDKHMGIRTRPGYFAATQSSASRQP